MAGVNPPAGAAAAMEATEARTASAMVAFMLAVVEIFFFLSRCRSSQDAYIQ
jgi:hypothetical protein